MFKVMCINWYPSNGSKDAWAINEMYIGRVLTVINNEHYFGYEFEEYPNIFWLRSNFAPLSDIDEMELELVNEKQLVNQ